MNNAPTAASTANMVMPSVPRRKPGRAPDTAIPTKVPAPCAPSKIPNAAAPRFSVLASTGMGTCTGPVINTATATPVEKTQTHVAVLPHMAQPHCHGGEYR